MRYIVREMGTSIVTESAIGAEFTDPSDRVTTRSTVNVMMVSAMSEGFLK